MQKLARLCFVLVGFAAATSSAYGQNLVSWYPDRLSSQLLRGTTNLVTASFTSSADLNNVDVIVVPELRPFLSVSPSHFDAIARNTTITFSMIFSIPEGAVPSIYDGTITLRSSSGSPRVFARPLPVTLLVQEPTSDVIPEGVSVPSADRFATDPAGLNYARDEIIAFVDPGATKDQITSLATRFGASFLGHDDRLHLYQLLLPFNDLAEASNIISQLRADPVVSFALPGFFLPATTTTPNDPSWSVPTQFSWAQDLIHLREAWDRTTGNANVTMGIVDVGADFNHEDLVIDGLQSDLRFNFGAFREHGTAVTSLISAVGNNARGLAGVMWNSHALIFSCSARQGNNVYEPLCQSLVVEAIGRGARVINISIAVNLDPVVCYPSTPPQQLAQWLQDSQNGWLRAIHQADSVPGGVLFVFGAGNDATSFEFTVPARLSNTLPNVISVGAVDQFGDRSSYSNYGAISVWAPGGDDFFLRMCGDRHTIPTNLTRSLIWTAQPDNTYGFFSPGTSLAAPFVSGVAGLMLSAKPTITATEIKNVIVSSADATGKFDPSGNAIKILNAFRAVQQALSPPVPSGLVQLTDFKSGQLMAHRAISADGSKIIFAASGDPTGQNKPITSGAFTMNSDGSGIVELPSSVFYGSLSPDGTKIVFSAEEDLVGSNPNFLQIFVANSDGSNPVQVTRLAGRNLGGTISATGKLAFSSDRDFTGQNPTGALGVFTINVNGTDVKQLFLLPPGTRLTNGAIISASGSKVAFCVQQNTGGFRIFSVNPDGTGLRELVNVPEGFSGPVSISGNGFWIVFSSFFNINGLNPSRLVQVFVVSADGSTIKRASETAGIAHEGAISTDGSKVVYHSCCPPNIFFSNSDGSSTARLTSSNGLFETILPSISGDARIVVFRSFDNLTGENPSHLVQLFAISPP